MRRLAGGCCLIIMITVIGGRLFAGSTSMILRNFDVSVLITNNVLVNGGSKKTWASYFSAEGVTWPRGSYLKSVPSTAHILVKNTPENLTKISRILAGSTACRLEIEFQFIETNVADVKGAISAKTLDVGLLHKMIIDGKGRILFAPRVVTTANRLAVIKTSSADGNTNKGKKDIAAEMPDDTESAVFTFKAEESEAFRITLFPSIADDGLLNLSLDCHYLTTVVSMPFSKTVLIGGGCKSTDPDKLVYILATAWITKPI